MSLGKASAEVAAFGMLALFADLYKGGFSLIHLPINEVYYDTSTVIYEAGETGALVFTIRSGLAKLIHYLPDGMQRIVRLLRQGDTLGPEVLLGRDYKHAAVVLWPGILLPDPAWCRVTPE